MIQPLLPNHIADFASSGRRLETIRRWPIRDAPKARVPEFRSQFKVSATNGFKSNDDVDTRPSRGHPGRVDETPAMGELGISPEEREGTKVPLDQRTGAAASCDDPAGEDFSKPSIGSSREARMGLGSS